MGEIGQEPTRAPQGAPQNPLLSEREAAVLAGVLEGYLALGTPVGSRALAQGRPDSPSSATIRHVMATLEQAGYLRQPHTSAGRVPTPLAIRWWLRQMKVPRPLDSELNQSLERTLREAREASDETTLWIRASEYLAEVTQQMGVVAVEPWYDAGLKYLRFFRLTDLRVLAILVTTDGQVRERVGLVPEAYTQAEMDAAARYFNLNFPGATLSRIRRELRHRLEEERAAYDELLKRVLVLSHSGVLAMEDTGAVYFQGADHMAGVLDAAQLSELLGRMTQKTRWLDLLTGIAPAAENTVEWDTGSSNLPHASLGRSARQWLRVQVGLDQDGMPEISLISTNYRNGAIGIIGTTRMEYERALGAVARVKDLFDRVLGDERIGDGILGERSS